MSGIVSGIGKVFATVGSAAARVGKAVLGVGATTFTAGAATGAGSIASGGLAGIISKFTGGGVLGNVLTGAITQAGYGALIGGAVSALSGGSFGKGALMGGLGGALSGGLMGAAGLNPDPLTQGFGRAPTVNGVDGIVTGSTATGAVPTGKTVAPLSDAAFNARAGTPGTPTIYSPGEPPPMTGATSGASGGGGLFEGGLGKFLTSETGGGIIAGIGKGLFEGLAAKEAAKERQKDRDAELAQEMRRTQSYNIDPRALHGPVGEDVGRPTPAAKFNRPRYQYDPAQGRVVYG